MAKRLNGNTPEVSGPIEAAPPPGLPMMPGMQPLNIAMTPERQMMIRIWSLEDECQRLALQNSELQTALAKATPVVQSTDGS